LVGPDLFFDAEADGLLVVVEEVLGWLRGVRGRDVPDEELIGVEAGRGLERERAGEDKDGWRWWIERNGAMKTLIMVEKRWEGWDSEGQIREVRHVQL
jgi:hypothetical protein